MWRVEHERFSNVWNLNLAGADEGKHLCAAAHCVLVIPVTPPHIVIVRLAPTLSHLLTLHSVAPCSCYSCYTSSYWFGTHSHPVTNPCTFPVTPSHIECETRAHPVTPSSTVSIFFIRDRPTRMILIIFQPCNYGFASSWPNPLIWIICKQMLRQTIFYATLWSWQLSF